MSEDTPLNPSSPPVQTCPQAQTLPRPKPRKRLSQPYVQPRPHAKPRPRPRSTSETTLSPERGKKETLVAASPKTEEVSTWRVAPKGLD